MTALETFVDGLDFGEGPRWHENRLWYSDFFQGAVFAVDATSYFSRPGPRVVDGLEILAWAIHADSFPEPAPGSISRLGR
jgi:sugar lactone lactonase YvrE